MGKVAGIPWRVAFGRVPDRGSLFGTGGRGVDKPLIGNVDGERVKPGKLGVVLDVLVEEWVVCRE